MMEPMLGGELLDLVINSGKFEAKYARAIFKQLCSAVHYMHSERGVAHRDLKLDNIMIGKGNVIKIIDQGFVCPIEGERGTGFSNEFKGTKGYSCPEKLKRGHCHYSPVQDDLFALAVILFSLHLGVPPVTEEAVESDATYKYVCAGRMSYYWSLYQRTIRKKDPNFVLDMDFMDLMSQMLSYDPESRLSMVEILSHPWLSQGYTASDLELSQEIERRYQSI